MNWGELKTEVLRYCERDDADFISRLPTFRDITERKIFRGVRDAPEGPQYKVFRGLRCVVNETVSTLTVTGANPTVLDIPTTLLEVKTISVVGGPPLDRLSDRDMNSRYDQNSGVADTPEAFARIGSQIKFWRPSANDFDIEFIFYEDLAGNLVSDDDETQLLVVAPDIYLYGMIAEGGRYLEWERDRVAKWDSDFRDALISINEQTSEDEYSGYTGGVSSVYADGTY